MGETRGVTCGQVAVHLTEIGGCVYVGLDVQERSHRHGEDAEHEDGDEDDGGRGANH